MLEYRGLVIHIAEGYYEGTISYQKNPGVEVSSHFVVSDGAKGQGTDGDIAQLVDTSVTAYTQAAGNGRWLSVENAGFTPHPLTPAQIESVAQLFAEGHTRHGWPLQIANTPNDRGLGHHSMGCNYNWGHCDCPGPNIIAQKQQIVNRAIEIVNGGDMTPGESWVLHVMNYRLEGIKAMRDPIVVPDRADLGQKGFSEANLLAQAVNAGSQPVDVSELAAEIVAQLPPATLTVQDVQNACAAAINTIAPLVIKTS